MAEEHKLHWLEESIQKIEARNTEPIIISAGKTPSGHVHVGILRELIIGDSLRRIFEKKGKNVIFRIFFDSLDAAKRFPPYIDKSFGKKYLGQPFSKIPAPFTDIEANSYAEYFGNELLGALPQLGIKVQGVWTHKLYDTEEMKNKIRVGLKNSDEVKKIVLEHITHNMNNEDKEKRTEMYKTWMPAMVICENCGCTQKKLKDGTIKPNRVIEYLEDEDSVTYECPACGNTGKVSIKSGLVKLNWRLDWPAKWSLNPKNTFESSGKDHFTKVTGSWSVSTDLCEKIYGYEGPVGLGYEWVRLGDNDMGTSRGVVFMPKTYLTMVEPDLIRMLVLKTNPGRHISFRIEEIALLYDEFEKLERIYYDLEKAETEEMKKEIQFLYPLIKAGEITKECPPQIPFKFLMIMSQLTNLLSIEDIIDKAQEDLKTRGINTKIEKSYMEKRIEQTKNWLKYLKQMIEQEKDPKFRKKLGTKAAFFEVPETITTAVLDKLDEKQKTALNLIYTWVNSIDELNEDNLKTQMIAIRDQIEISAGKLFQAIYLILIGTKKGPRLGSFMSLLDIEWLRNRFSAFK